MQAITKQSKLIRRSLLSAVLTREIRADDRTRTAGLSWLLLQVTTPGNKLYLAIKCISRDKVAPIWYFVF